MNQSQLRALYKNSRIGFSSELTSVVDSTGDFANSAANALGEISREEAIEAIKKFFCEKMDLLR